MQVRRRCVCAAAAVADAPPSLGADARPDKNGRFGKFGGKYVPETLMPALEELEAAYEECKSDPAFQVRHAPCWPRHAPRGGAGAASPRERREMPHPRGSKRSVSGVLRTSWRPP